MKALILGSTGLVGEILLHKLLADDFFSNVTAYVRRPTGFKHPKYLESIVDFEKIENSIDSDIVFCCLGTTMKVAGSKEAFKKVDFEYPLKIARLQKEHSKKFILISALGASSQSKIFYNQIKGHIEKELIKLNYHSLVILRPSLIDGAREKTNQPFRAGEQISRFVLKFANSLLVGALARYRSVTPDRIADRMIDQAKQDFSGIKIIESEQI